MGFILLLDKQKVMLFCLFQIINLKKGIKKYSYSMIMTKTITDVKAT